MKSDNNFKIICISRCVDIAFNNTIEVGSQFDIDDYNYNYSDDYTRLIVDDRIMALVPKRNFKKLQDWREEKLNKLIEE